MRKVVVKIRDKAVAASEVFAAACRSASTKRSAEVELFGHSAMPLTKPLLSRLGS